MSDCLKAHFLLSLFHSSTESPSLFHTSIRSKTTLSCLKISRFCCYFLLFSGNDKPPHNGKDSLCEDNRWSAWNILTWIWDKKNLLHARRDVCNRDIVLFIWKRENKKVLKVIFNRATNAESLKLSDLLKCFINSRKINCWNKFPRQSGHSQN